MVKFNEKRGLIYLAPDASLMEIDTCSSVMAASPSVALNELQENEIFDDEF